MTPSGSRSSRSVAASERRRTAYAAQHGIARAHGSYEALLAEAEVEAVYVSLPNALHHEWTMKALAAGKHVLCEKPYSRHPDEVEAAFAAAETADLVLMEAFMYRHHPQTRLVEQLVQAGALGRLLSIRACFTFPLTDLTNVRASTELDGGALMDVGCYCVSGARLLAGEPLSVSAVRVDGPTGVDMALHGTLCHENDVVTQFEASFLAPRRQQLEVVGEDAVLTVQSPWRVDWPGDALITRDGQTERLDVPQASSYVLELENLAAAVSGDAEPLLGRDDALGQAQVIAGLLAVSASV